MECKMVGKIGNNEVGHFAKLPGKSVSSWEEKDNLPSSAIYIEFLFQQMLILEL
jgi:hypothetical protein